MAYGNVNMCISKERLTVLMKKIFVEELEKQQQSLLKSITGNFEITVKELKIIKSRVNELKKSIKFTEDFLEQKVQNMQSSLEEKAEEIYVYLIGPGEVEKKLTDLEDHSRRNNLHIVRIGEENDESWDD